MKKCIKCEIEKSRDSFYKNRSNKDGIGVYCKSCDSYLRKTKYLKVLKQSRKNWYKNNKEQHIKDINNRSKNRDFGLYRTYWAMIRRCKYPSQIKYKYYGGKDIKVEWESYNDFKRDMFTSFLKHIEKYGKRQTTIDRIDSDKNYCLSNCRWATYSIQNSHLKKRYRKVIHTVFRLQSLYKAD